MRKTLVGLLCGVIGVIINIGMLLFAPKLEMEVYLSTTITWLVIGILISICSLKLNAILKGIVISLLVSAPSLVYSISDSLSGAILTISNTIIIGGIIGYCIEYIYKLLFNKLA